MRYGTPKPRIREVLALIIIMLAAGAFLAWRIPIAVEQEQQWRADRLCKIYSINCPKEENHG